MYQPQTTTRKGHGEKGIGCDQAVWLEDTKGSNKNEHRLLVKPTVLIQNKTKLMFSIVCSVTFKKKKPVQFIIS